ncbi:MAG: hypothetical protein E7320_07270 [Clostridiales bacterium]|nr:hypothetical protein [Clostridiales bacterium]
MQKKRDAVLRINTEQSDDAPENIRGRPSRKTAYEIWSTQKELNEAFHIDMDDLIQEGTWSLFGCIDRFEPAKEFQFITYAAIAVRNAMLDYIRSQAATFEARYLNSFLRFQPYERTKLCILILLAHKNVIFQAQIPHNCVILLAILLREHEIK